MPPAQKEKEFVFGPVPSRRLGRSLGLDLVPFKTCSFDCTYCQLGRTTDLTTERREYRPVDEVLSQLEARLAAGAAPDCITLSGSGEPTLHTGLRPLMQGVRRLTDRPIVVLTNGSLLWQPDVREDLQAADIVIPSLDAGDAEMFGRVNRPHPKLGFEQVVEGLETFCQNFAGEVWLEIFLLGGLTTDDAHLRELAGIANRISPERVQLNTVTRPPCEADARPASAEEMHRAEQILGERAGVIADRAASSGAPGGSLQAMDVVELLARRPCTLDDLASGLRAHPLEVAKHLERLLRSRTVTCQRHGKGLYYKIARHGNDDSQRD